MKLNTKRTVLVGFMAIGYLFYGIDRLLCRKGK